MARKSFRHYYIRFRGGPGFLVMLFGLIVGWILWNWFAWRLQFDAPPFIGLNLLLSAEAAFTMPVLWMEQKQAEAQTRAETGEIAKLVKAVLQRLDEEESENAPGM